MPRLENFPTYRQHTVNTCWACASRSIINWYVSIHRGGTRTYNSDQELANAWRRKIEEDTGVIDATLSDIDIQRSAAGLLEDLGFHNVADEHSIPTEDEIDREIRDNRPLLAIVGDTLPDRGRNLDAANGHWVVIVGIEDDQLDVFDPADGQINTVTYNAQTYQQGVYWQNTSYVDPRNN